MNDELQVFADADAVARAAAERFVQAADEAVVQRGRFIAVLSGGSTPRRLYRLLAQDPFRSAVAWDKSLLLFGDERCVPHDHEQSNYRMVKESLLDPAGIPDKRVYRIECERPPAEAAVRYQLRVRDLFVGEVHARFDLVLLGLGTDGHTASLFPDSEALNDSRRWVAANFVAKLDSWRVTMTLPALCGARRLVFLVTGEEKSSVLAEAFAGAEHAVPHPAERVVPVDGERTILVDKAAASRL